MRRILLISLVTTGCNLFSGVPEGDLGFDDPKDASEEVGADVAMSDMSETSDMSGEAAPDMSDLGADAADADAGSAWWDQAWSYRVPVTFESEVQASEVPIPLRIPSAVVALVVDDGADLQITDHLGEPLPFERARWGSAPVVWVSAEIDPSSAGPHAYIYFGNDDPVPDASSAQMWNDFLSVFHFDNADIGLNTREPDWTATLIDEPSGEDGLVGQALDAQSGTLRYASAANDTDLLNVQPGEVATFSACFATPDSTTSQMLVWKEGGCVGWSLRVSGGGDAVYGLAHGAGCDDWEDDSVSSPQRIDDEAWHCVTSRVDRAAGVMSISVDGEHVASDTVDTERDAAGGTFRIGNNYNDTQPTLGLIDEVWIMNGWPSDEWVEVTHAAMLGEITSFGDIESRP